MPGGVEILQFEDDEGGNLNSWYAEGHYDVGDFALFLVRYILEDCGDDMIPLIDLGRIEHTYMRRGHNDIESRWNAIFTDTPDRGAQPVTVFDSEVRKGGRSCAVAQCNNSASSAVPVSAAVEPGPDRPALTVYFSLCKEHRSDMPDPSYRVYMVPVGATIVLPTPDEAAS